MKRLTTFLIVALSFTFSAAGSQAFAQDRVQGDDAAVESDQLEATILELREQLMKLEKSRASVGDSSSDSVESSSVNLTRSGNGAYDNSQTVDMGPSLLPSKADSTVLAQHVAPYEQPLPLPMATTLPNSSSWIEQPMTVPMVTNPSVLSEAIISNVQPVYETPVAEWGQPAPVAVQPLVEQQAPVAQTIIVNVYPQAPAAQNGYFPTILAPIYGPAPIRVVSPRRGCCLRRRR